MNKDYESRLKKQQYGLVGKNSAVKICTWTKKSLKDEDFCYKQKFYGINSHRCCQMSTTVDYCQNSCIFCWRTLETTRNFLEMPKSDADKPEEIYDKLIEEQKRQLSGFKGNPKVNMKKFQEAQDPMHFAISLTGEPTMYPYLSEFVELLKKKGKTSFVVSNGLRPEVIRAMTPPTQLYVSLDAPNKELFLKIDRSALKDAWERLNETLEVLSEIRDKTRTVLRLTLIKGYNMVEPENYVKLIEKANPLFVELKAYMFVGSSRQRMSLSNMPYHEEVREFAQKIADLSDYEIEDEKKESRVVLLMKPEDRDRRFLKL
ncbi:MAG: 4-demethylwyosine synthase TYW1 [Nitrospiraceae bacterium]|nr:4-demethylwyosine synthase TYW1 [Nitrospiraceae bacterium]